MTTKEQKARRRDSVRSDNERLRKDLADAQKTIRAFVSPDADGYDYTSELRFANAALIAERDSARTDLAALVDGIRALADEFAREATYELNHLGEIGSRTGLVAYRDVARKLRALLPVADLGTSTKENG